MAVITTSLDQGWYWKERDPSVFSVIDEVGSVAQGQRGWTPAASFPSEIHCELIKAGRIPDPFKGFNEHEVQWVGEREWLYYTTFDLPQSTNVPQDHALIFEGLDTVCDVYLNGVNQMLGIDNMFKTHTLQLPEHVKRNGNVLLLHFRPAKLVAKALEHKYGRVRAGSANLGDPSRVYLRKAQYNWRWDWGPELLTCGPYRPIKLVTFHARITSVTVCSTWTASHTLDQLRVRVDVERLSTVAHVLSLVLKDKSGTVLMETRDTLNNPWDNINQSKGCIVRELVLWDLAKRSIKLWWPTGYGGQEIYHMEVSLWSNSGQVIDSHTKNIGFRRVNLIHEDVNQPDRHGTGTTFIFEVNGVRMFMGGSNWIPAHSFLTELCTEDYRAWLTLLRDGNQNMVRVWGGGVYEPDCFYDICDELGILVWQDFQFACGVYPAHADFVENVREEARQNVQRLSHHPSIALFCGNNEDYQQVLQWGDVSDLPSRTIYEKVLPAVVSEVCNTSIPYHRGSPYGGQGWDTSDPTVGDIHQWDIWAGKERPWQEYAFRNGRFVSEFGIPSFPDIKTVDYWLDGAVEERWAQSKLMAQHNRAGSHERRFAILMNENFRVTSDLEAYVYNTQIMQSEAASLAYRMWRREWRGKGKEYTAGALIWQLNDCWPVVSWSIVDFFRRPKPAYYTIARELKPIAVGILRTVSQNRENDRPKQFYEFGAFRSVGASIEVWGTNRTLERVSVHLELWCFDLLSDWKHGGRTGYILLPNQSTELLSIPCPCPLRPEGATTAVTASHSVVVSARLVSTEEGSVLARYADWPQPFRYVDFPDPGLRVRVAGEEVTVEVERPVKGLFLTVDGADMEPAKWSDNALDVFPGEPQTVEVRGLAGKNVRLRAAYMGCERGQVVYGGENDSGISELR
ncbi:glycoside hydrolase [Trametes meyenii]|nr:glycoside hydrolase [Trametes meyenii]